MTGTIRVGIGGWTFPPWRGVFYPPKLKQADELAHASRNVTAIEINSTFYSLQKRESFAKWARETPESFVFALKGSNYCTNWRDLASAGPGLERFFGQGLAALGAKLGPILWQFAATKPFDPADFAAFLDLLPPSVEDLRLRHCVEVRHASFADPRFVALCRERGVAICLSDGPGWPLIADVTADFVYARLMRGGDHIDACYPAAELDRWARRLTTYADGAEPDDLLRVSEPSAACTRDVFAFFIRGGKIRAPAGAMELIRKLRDPIG